MVRKFACILLTVGVAALLCGRSQIRQRDASELQGWLTENGYQDLADIFLDEGMVKVTIPAPSHLITFGLS